MSIEYMKRILILIIGLIGVAYGQSAPTSAKTRFVNGIYLGTKLDAYFNTADSNAIYWRADSVVMAKYKGTARALAFVGGNDFIRNQSGSNLAAQTAKFSINDTAILGGKVLIGNSTPLANNGAGSIAPLEVATTASGGGGIVISSNDPDYQAETYVLGMLPSSASTSRKAGVMAFRPAFRTPLQEKYVVEIHSTSVVDGVGNDRYGFVFYADRGMTIFPKADATPPWDSSKAPGRDILRVYGFGTFDSTLTSNGFIKSGGTSSQFLKADGTVDGNTYLTSSDITGKLNISDTATMLSNYRRKTTLIENADLRNSAITINGNSTALGGSVSVGTVTSVAASAGTGISISGSPITSSGTLTITNTAPDQTVTLTAGTGISVSGTYPNFTVTNTSPSSGGTVTSVTASAPLSSSGGTTPNITISQATTSTNGFLTSTDWNTFNGKQAQLNGTGFVRFSGTTPSYITGTSSQFVKADGTLDGTSYATAASLSGYVDVTTAQSIAGLKTFSQTTSRITNFNSTNASGGYYALQKSGADQFYIGNSESLGGTSNNIDLYAVSGKGFNIYTNANASPSVTISSTGEATFSSLAGTGDRVVIANSSGTLSTSNTITSGTYTPTASNAQNAGTITAYGHQYTRIGNIVTVSGVVQYTTTASGVVSAIEITLPFSTTFTSTLEATGTATCSSNFIAGYVSGNNLNNKAVISFKAGASGTVVVANYTFQYQVL